MKYYFPLLLLLFNTNVAAQINIESLDQMVREHVEKNNFDGTVLIADQGEIVYINSFGYLDRHLKTEHSNSSKYGIASVTKLFTAILVMQLVEQEQLTLETPLSAFESLSNLGIPNAGQITPHHLMLHISGLPNEPDDIYRGGSKTPAEIIAYSLENGDQNGSFGDYNYNNVDYIILGMIIEERTGMSWRENVQEKILDPYGMTHTGFRSLNGEREDIANSYHKILFWYTKDPRIHYENFGAAASMYSTAEDLLKLDQAMYGDSLLTAQSKEIMFTSYPEYNYTGYSVWTFRYPFVDSIPLIMERRGGVMGMNSVLVR
ncbi:MAG: beta-lactamase family protein, partial [Balneolales bacterium]|nr:beta-lactamase family protein [Balneolales bacterium]